MKLMGQALLKFGRTNAYVGVVPAFAEAGNGLVAEDILEPNHSGFVLVNGYHWGDEVETMYGLAAYLSANVPSVTILVNGGGYRCWKLNGMYGKAARWWLSPAVAD